MFHLVLVFLACYRQLVRGSSTEFNLFFVKGDPIKHGLDTIALKRQSTVVTRARQGLSLSQGVLEKYSSWATPASQQTVKFQHTF